MGKWELLDRDLANNPKTSVLPADFGVCHDEDNLSGYLCFALSVKLGGALASVESFGSKFQLQRGSRVETAILGAVPCRAHGNQRLVSMHIRGKSLPSLRE